MVSRLLVNVLFGECKALVVAGGTEAPLQGKGQLCCHLITYYRETFKALQCLVYKPAPPFEYPSLW